MKKLIILLLIALPLHAAEVFGPYRASLVRVIDGDTIVLDIYIWPQQVVRTGLRLDGVDTPEMGGRARCEAEMKAGQTVAMFVAAWLSEQPGLVVAGIKQGKFAGRVLGNIYSGEQNLSQMLLESGYARPYSGGRRESWCE